MAACGVVAIGTAAGAFAALAVGSGDGSISLTLQGRYAGGGAEISAYDRESKRLFVTDAENQRVDIVSISDPAHPVLVGAISVAPGSPNSVAVDEGIVAVAVEAPIKTDPGTVRFYDANGAAAHPGVTVGALPDMLTFTRNHDYLLVANEGEPSGYGTPPAGQTFADPEGSVSVIDLRKGLKKLTQTQVRTASFSGVSIPAGVRIFGPGATAPQDLEPEYIAVDRDSRTAWVTLQENNAIAELDITNAASGRCGRWASRDHNAWGNGLDPSDRDNVGNTGRKEIVNRPVFGMYQPDGIVAYKADGGTYLVTANEGDARDWPGLTEESRVSDLTLEAGVGDAPRARDERPHRVRPADGHQPAR